MSCHFCIQFHRQLDILSIKTFCKEIIFLLNFVCHIKYKLSSKACCFPNLFHLFSFSFGFFRVLNSTQHVISFHLKLGLFLFSSTYTKHLLNFKLIILWFKWIFVYCKTIKWSNNDLSSDLLFQCTYTNYNHFIRFILIQCKTK